MQSSPPHVLLVLGLAAGSALSSHAQGGFTAQTRLLEERDRRGAVSWDSARPLTWADFQAPPPTVEGREAALTHSGFIYALECSRKALAYGVLAVFDPDQSWVRPQVLTDSAQSHALPHEQGHFNISELGARRLRAQLETFNVPCASADTAFARVAQSAFVRERALQAQYDEDTIHGTVPDAQARWMVQIRAALDSLASARDPFIVRKY